MGSRDRRDRESSNAFGLLTQASTFSDTTPPIISAISSGTPNATDATITWTTNEVADSRVFWGLTTAYAGLTSPILNPTLLTSHSVQITGLTTATLYHYKVVSKDAQNNYTSSADGTFTTA